MNIDISSLEGWLLKKKDPDRRRANRLLLVLSQF